MLAPAPMATAGIELTHWWRRYVAPGGIGRWVVVGAPAPAAPHRKRIEYIPNTTRPTDASFDGSTGLGMFRPHAYWFWFLLDDFRAMLTPEQRGRDIVAALERERPPLVVVDDAVHGLGPEVLDYYQPPLRRHAVRRDQATTTCDGPRWQRRPPRRTLGTAMMPAPVLVVFGTRPEAIKLAPVVRALAVPDSGLRPVVCVTDQHREMLDQVLDFFGIAPDHRLDVMRAGQTPAEVAARVLERLPSVLASVRPAAVLVQGDTTTTLAAALAAFYGRVPVGHVEAGLRTPRLDAPFPEEANRRLTTVLTRWHFAATPWARDNLLREGVEPGRVSVTGNPVVDALQWAVGHLGSRRGELLPGVERDRRLVLVTAHRRESFGAPFLELCAALRDLAERNPEVELVYPVHLNPDVQKPVQGILHGCARVHLLPPVDYCQLVDLLERCSFVLTDSGGIQEEAPSLGKPCLVMREVTERPEGVEAGTARLVGTSHARIVAEAERLLRDPAAYDAMARAHNPFGDGRASERIAAVLRSDLTTRDET